MSKDKESKVKKRQELNSEVIIIGTNSDSNAMQALMRNLTNAIDFFAKENTGGAKIVPLLLTKRGSLGAISSFLKEQKVWKEQKEVFKYINDPEKVESVFRQAKLMYMNVQMVKGGRFGLKDVVDLTNMNFKGAKQMIDLLYAFGLLGKVEENSREMYEVFINPEDRVNFINQRIKEQEEILGQFKAMLDVEIATEINEKAEPVESSS
jgi:predicted transcriptional regulator